MCYILPNIYDTKKGTAWQALFRDFLCKFSRFFRAFCPFLLHSFTDCQIMKLPASVRPPAALIRTSLPLFSVLWYSFLPWSCGHLMPAAGHFKRKSHPRRISHSWLPHGCGFLSFTISPTSYTISSLPCYYLILRHVPSTFPMLSLITRSA